MTTSVPGVPSFLTREQYVALIESMGINPNDVRKLEFNANSIDAVVFVRDENGKKVLSSDYRKKKSGFLKHRICIPIVNPPTSDSECLCSNTNARAL